MSHGEAIRYEPFAEAHLDGVVALCQELSWPSYADEAHALQAFSAPGAITWVAVCGTEIVGLAHLLTDGRVQAHLSLVGVLPGHRRRGLARRLVGEAFRISRAKWLDLVSEPGSEEFYRSFLHHERVGFRIYPYEPAG
jgi:ribosomal protein S18 acetylase RimI-like enzyme